LDITKSEFVGTVANNQTHKKKKSFETAVNALLEGRMEDSSLSRVNEETINPNAISSTDYSSASLECCTLNGNPSFAQHLNLSISNLRECFYDVTKSFDSHALVMQQHFLLHPSPSIASIEGIMNNSYYGITTTPHNNIFYMRFDFS
jgi:hypothetical protein